MNNLYTTLTPELGRSARRRSIPELLAPLETLAGQSPNLLSKPLAPFYSDGAGFEIPRYLFIGPRGGDDPIRIGIFAAIHGDEPEGAAALVNFLQVLDQQPDFARDFCIFAYPVCNPTGYEDQTRYSRRGHDLNREFWNNSSEPEVRSLQAELSCHAFDGIISLHSDDTTDGLYGFVRGATLTRHLLEPALRAAEELLPRNRNNIIDGFNAHNGIIHQGYHGILSGPPKVRPKPFEIVLETPQSAPVFLQERAFIVALFSILAEYRKLAAYAPNL